MIDIKSVAITGSTGMIGLALTKYLIKKNIKVIMFIRENSQKKDLIPNSDLIEVVECNLNNLKNIKLELKCDCFIHLGWDQTIGEGRDNTYLQLRNIEYTLDAIKLAKTMNAKKFVGVGSQAEYGIKSEKLSINTSCNPITGYGIAKYSAGKLAGLLCKQLNIEFNWIRVLSVYGENDSPKTLYSYLKKCFIEDISPELTKCEQIWDYIEVNDAVEIIYRICKYGENQITYPLGSGKPIVLKEFVEKLKNKYNSNVEIKYGAKAYSDSQVMYLVADMEYLTKLGIDIYE